MNFFKSGFGKVAKHQTFEYEPRYGSDEKKQSNREDRIKFEKGALLKKSNTLSKHRAPIFSHKDKLSNDKKWKLLLLLGGLGVTIWYLLKNMEKGWAYIIFPLLFILVLLVLFISTNNQR